MEFILTKSGKKGWSLTPAEGRFEGIEVATAEGVNLNEVRFFEGKMVGVLKAVWGLEVCLEQVYEDEHMVRSLCLGKLFRTDCNRTAVMDRDGVKDSYTLRLLKGAQRVMLLGQSIRMKGSY